MPHKYSHQRLKLSPFKIFLLPPFPRSWHHFPGFYAVTLGLPSLFGCSVTLPIGAKGVRDTGLGILSKKLSSVSNSCCPSNISPTSLSHGIFIESGLTNSLYQYYGFRAYCLNQPQAMQDLGLSSKSSS